MTSPLVTRFPNGVTNVADNSPFADLRMPDPTQYHTYFNDFDTYAAAEWTVTETQAGATQALTNGDGGLLLLTNSAADNDLVALQKVGESFTMEAGKKAFFKCRFRVSDATQSDVVIGLQVTDITPLDVTDGIYFIKDDDAASLSIICRKDATTGSNRVNNIATLANNTYVTLSWFYDGVDRLEYSVNDVTVGSMSASASFLPDTSMTISFALQNGEAVAKTMTVDYIFVAKER
jgi:hypothetical protein